MGDLDVLRGPGWVRLLRAARRRLESSGGSVTGSVGVGVPSDEERRVVIAVTGRHRPPDVARVSVQLSDVDGWLRRSHGLGLIAALDALGPPLRDRPGERSAESQARAALRRVTAASRHAGEEWYEEWAASIVDGSAAIRLIRRGAADVVALAVGVLDRLPAPDVPLPLLAEQACGDTKALSGTPVAGLVLRALTTWQGTLVARGAAGVRELWESAGVVVDDLASQALVLNLPASGGLLGGWLSSAAAEGVPFRVTLQQLTAWPITVTAPQVFVCENPAVLRLAASRLGAKCASLICAEGVPSIACRRLVAACVAAGATVWWRNDFDWPGLRMTAAALAVPAVRPWRMGTDDYSASLDASAAPNLVGSPAPSPWDPALADRMAAHGRAVMEERLVELLLADLAGTQGGQPEGPPSFD